MALKFNTTIFRNLNIESDEITSLIKENLDLIINLVKTEHGLSETGNSSSSFGLTSTPR